MTIECKPIGARINFSWVDDIETPIDGFYVSFEPFDTNTDEQVFHHSPSLENLQSEGINDIVIWDIEPVYESELSNWRKSRN